MIRESFSGPFDLFCRRMSSIKTASPYTRLIIDHIIEETRGFKTFVFREGHGIAYESGQFLTLSDLSGKDEIRRSYSITSSSFLQEPLSIGVKRIDNGYFSRKLYDRIKEGDTLLTTGAAGFFRLPENIQAFQQVFFFAAGSGISPIFSLLKTLLYKYPHIRTTLIYSNPSTEKTAFYTELKQLENKFSETLHIDFLYSSITDLRKARLNSELLLELISNHSNQKDKTVFFLCGPESYMRMIQFHLVEEGFSGEFIKKEDFNPGGKKTTLPSPPDHGDYTIRINLHGTSHVFLAAFPDSILQAARKEKLNLPYSCETGKCGSCAAICDLGEVWMSNNEVLTDKDLMRGYILTCTGHAQKGGVSLKIE